MNLSVSYDWLREYVDLKGITPEQFASRVSLSGPGIERLHPQGAGLEHIVLGQVVSIGAHPNADALRIATVLVGKEKLSLVCGGSNLKERQWVAVAKIGAKVRWHGEGEPVELKPAVIRGVKSSGMMCAANEIGLFDAFPHAEREILDLGEALGVSSKWKAGTPLADLFGFASDVVMDVEVTTNRPDALSLTGLAREAAVILGRKLTGDGAAACLPVRQGPVNLKVKIADKSFCPRFMAVRMDNVRVGPSPWWMKRRLISAGVRPINNLVDITNYVMLELGQPMHVYDASKIRGQKLEIRRAKKGETLAALDGKTYQLDGSMLVVADAEEPVAVAGVMGGEETGVTTETASVIFEAATFDPVSVRKTARALNLYSDSQLRFEKGLSTEAPAFAIARAVELCGELSGGSVASSVADHKAGIYKPKTFSIGIGDISKLIGVPIPLPKIKSILNALGFEVKGKNSTLEAAVPWWRDHDIESGRDLVEEVARVYGYAHLPPVFPAGISAQEDHPEMYWEDRLRTIAKGAGLTEAYTYSFVSRELMGKGGFDPATMLRVTNHLSSDFEFMRTSLLPSLLQVVADNQDRFREQKLFEVTHVYFQTPKNDLPDEQLELAAAFFGTRDPWREAKGFAEHIYQELGISSGAEFESLEWKRLDESPFWHPGRSVQAFAGERLIGTMGEIHPNVIARFGIEGRVAMLHVQVRELVDLARKHKPYKAVPMFPEAKRDLALLVRRDVDVQTLARSIRETESALRSVEWFDTFTGEGIPANKKSVAFHLTFGRDDRTLETKEVDEQMDVIKRELEKKFEVSVRE